MKKPPCDYTCQNRLKIKFPSSSPLNFDDFPFFKTSDALIDALMMISGWIGQWGRCCLYWWLWWWLLSEIMIPLMVMAKTGALVMLMVTRTWPWSSGASTIRNDGNHNKPAQLLPVPWKCIVEMTQNLTNIDPTSKRSNSGSRQATKVLNKGKSLKFNGEDDGHLILSRFLQV